MTRKRRWSYGRKQTYDWTSELYVCNACHAGIPRVYVEEHWVTNFTLPCACAGEVAHGRFIAWSVARKLTLNGS